jgi:hypothetical protein
MPPWRRDWISPASQRDKLMSARAASTRAQSARSSSRVTVTFFMDTNIVFPCFRVKRSAGEAASSGRAKQLLRRDDKRIYDPDIFDDRRRLRVLG